MIDSKKNYLLFVLKILVEDSDINHPLTHQYIIDKLENNYLVEIKRKALGNALRLIEDFLDNNDFFGLSLTITYKGSYIDSRLFDKVEIQYLIDAILSSRTLGSAFSNEIINKIQTLLPKREVKDYIISKPRLENDKTSANILYNVDIIMECIKDNKQVKFEYKDSKLKEFHVDPYYLINRNGYYYLFGAKGNKQNTSEYRIDKMSKVEKRKKNRRLISELNEVKPNFDINNYIKENPYGFNDEVITALIKPKDKKAISYLRDWFGDNIKERYKNKEKMYEIKSERTSLILIMLQYSDFLELVSPSEIREEIKSKANNILDMYN